MGVIEVYASDMTEGNCNVYENVELQDSASKAPRQTDYRSTPEV
jgi:hypothetical protein